MKARLALLVLGCTSVVLASSGHLKYHHREHNGMRLIKRQAAGDSTTGGGGNTGTTSQAAASPSNVASSSSSPNNNPLSSLAGALQPGSSSSSSSSTSPVSTSPEESTTDQETSTAISSSSPAAQSSSLAHSSALSPSLASNVPSASTSTGARSTVVSIVTPSSGSSASETIDSSSSSASSSSTALSDKKKEESSSGGIGHGTLIAIIVVASCVAGVGAIWTIIRKTKFSPSKRFESKLEPIDFVPEVPEYGNHNRSQSQFSGVGGGAYGGSGGGYAESLARSDSKASLRGQGMTMSESGGGLASIPYQQSPTGYGQQPFYGEGAYHGSPQLGYPQEQPTYYPALQRGLSSSSSLQHQAAGLGRMNTTTSNAAGGGHDYAAQARSQSRGPGGPQYY
ncbi:uncharacterized protein JCM6883_007586 [Sporobolomyces salmoneus]|uniref:uncharacterized protein n=1 Tax=Sporobolomyces salmoneus TaxID=183962 RepID=UPI0031755BDA